MSVRHQSELCAFFDDIGERLAPEPYTFIDCYFAPVTGSGMIQHLELTTTTTRVRSPGGEPT